MEVATNLRDDALKRAVDGLSSLITSAETIKLEEQNILRFSDHMIYVRDLLLKLRSQKARSALANFSPDSLCRLLERMLAEVNNAREAIEGYKSKRWIHRIMISPFVLSKLNQSSKEIAAVLQLLPFTQVNTALNIEAAVNAMILSLKSIELKQAADADAIRSNLDLYISENTGNRKLTAQILVTIARATGTATSSVFPIIEADEAQQIQELHNEPICQFTEMLKPCAGNAETTSSSARISIDAEMLNFSGGWEAWSTDEIASPPSLFFFCPLTYEIMEDPVSVSCDHSFERRNIEKYFSGGHKCCPLCRKELSSKDNLLELDPNHTLRSSILEWKQWNAQCVAERKAKMKLRDAADRIDMENMESTNRALEELQALFEEVPSCISKATTESSCKLVPKLAMLLKNGAANRSAASKNLLYIARFSDENKETIGRGGVIKCLLNLAKAEPNAIELLLELSKNMVVAQKIGENSKSTAPILISLLDNPNSYLAEKVRTLIENLSRNINFTIMMAKSGYFTPFLDQFNTLGNSEQKRAFMAEELAQMQLTETAASKLESELFISGLTVMLSSSLTSSRLASLKCIKRLIGFNGLRMLLSKEPTISALLCLVTDAAAEQQHKQEAVEVLASMIDVSQHLEQQINPSSMKLYSCNSIQNMLEQIKNSTPEGQVALLRLILLIVQQSDMVRDWIISDHNAMNCLFPAITEQNSNVRVNAVKLISYIAGNNPMAAIPFPPSPAREPILSSIITMLTTSCIVEERSAAANIISHLTPGDKSMDEMLHSSGILNALHNLISQARKSDELLENALGALLRCLNHSNSGLQMQVSKLEPCLVKFLSTGSPLAKQRAATTLAYLARCTKDSSPTATRSFFAWRVKEAGLCTVHGTSCSLQRVICLVKAKAVKPLVDMMDIKEPGVSEAALTALDTLFDSGCEFNAAADAIVESHGAAPILEVLESGPLPVKEKAFELFRKIYKNPGITSKERDKFEGILFYLLDKENGLKNKVKIFFGELFQNASPS